MATRKTFNPLGLCTSKCCASIYKRSDRKRPSKCHANDHIIGKCKLCPDKIFHHIIYCRKCDVICKMCLCGIFYQLEYVSWKSSEPPPGRPLVSDTLLGRIDREVQANNPNPLCTPPTPVYSQYTASADGNSTNRNTDSFWRTSGSSHWPSGDGITGGKTEGSQVEAGASSQAESDPCGSSASGLKNAKSLGRR